MGCSPHAELDEFSPGFGYENPPSPEAAAWQAEDD